MSSSANSSERARRLPLHPRPLPDEALSSWVRRLGRAYGLDTDRFQKDALGAAPLGGDELDRGPPESFIAVLATRTGLPPDGIRAMTLAAYVPLLLDALAPSPDLLACYADQSGCVLPPERRRTTPLPGFSTCVPWVTADLLDACPRGCRACLAADAIPYVRIHWQAAWMASCPAHGVLLEPAWVGAWGHHTERDKSAPPPLARLDRLTLAAVTTGLVVLPSGGTIHAGRWLRMLRTLVDEVTRPIRLLGEARDDIAVAWGRMGVPLGERTRFARAPFEALPADRRTTVLAVAGAMVGRALDGQLRTQRPVVSRKSRYGRFAEHRRGDGLCDILRRMPL